MPGVEIGGAVGEHELHQREQNRPAGFAKVRVHRQGRHLGDIATHLAHRVQVKNRLQRKAKHALPNQRNGAHHLAINLGAQSGGGGQRVVQGDAHAAGVGLHEARVHIGIVQQTKAGLQLFAGLGDLQHQVGRRRGIAINKRAIHRTPPWPGRSGEQLANPLVQELARRRADRMGSRFCHACASVDGMLYTILPSPCQHRYRARPYDVWLPCTARFQPPEKTPS